ncbi:MAG: helix-turn-helix domain-containing protein [Bacteroidota bacterium]
MSPAQPSPKPLPPPLPLAGLAGSLSFTFYWSMCFTGEPGYVWPPQVRPYSTLWLILEGEMDVTVAGERRVCGPRSLIALQPGVTVSARNAANCNVRLHSCAFDIRVWGELDFFRLYRVPAFRQLDDVDLLARPWEELNAELFSHHPALTLSAEAWAHVLVARWLESLEAAGELQPAASVDERLAKALAAIDADLVGEWTPRRLADLMCLSPVRMRQLFVKGVGVPPLRYVILRRIAHSRALLQDTEMPLVEIAQRCGFDDPRHFRRVFQRIAGVQPGACREQARLVGH